MTQAERLAYWNLRFTVRIEKPKGWRSILAYLRSLPEPEHAE